MMGSNDPVNARCPACHKLVSITGAHRYPDHFRPDDNARLCVMSHMSVHTGTTNHYECPTTEDPMTNISGETTTASYTPGPYIADRCTPSAFAICSDANVENSDIAMVYHKHPDNDHDAFYSDEAEALANAILLAAAPDLHRALHALRHGRLPDSDEAMLPTDIQALVDAALDKAVSG